MVQDIFHLHNAITDKGGGDTLRSRGCRTGVRNDGTTRNFWDRDLLPYIKVRRRRWAERQAASDCPAHAADNGWLGLLEVARTAPGSAL